MDPKYDVNIFSLFLFQDKCSLIPTLVDNPVCHIHALGSLLLVSSNMFHPLTFVRNGHIYFVCKLH